MIPGEAAYAEGALTLSDTAEALALPAATKALPLSAAAEALPFSDAAGALTLPAAVGFSVSAASKGRPCGTDLPAVLLQAVSVEHTISAANAAVNAFLILFISDTSVTRDFCI